MTREVQSKQSPCAVGELRALARALAAARTLPEMYEAALDAIIQLVPVDRSAVLVFNGGGGMKFVSSRGLSTEYQSAVQGHCPWDVNERAPAPILVANALTQEWPARLGQAIRKEGIGSLAFIPLVSRGRLVGKFMLYRNVPSEFAERDVMIASLIADQVAFAIDRHATEQTLTRERNLFVAGPTVVFRWRNAPGWPVEYASPNTADVFGIPAAEFVSGRVPYANVVHPGDLHRVAQEVTSAAASGALTFSQQYRVTRPDGAVVHLHDVTTVIRSAEGEATHFLGYVTDVTESVNATGALQGHESRLKLMIDSASVGICEMGLEGEFLTTNPAACRMLGLSPEEMLRCTCPQMTHPDDLAENMRLHKGVIAGEFPSYVIHKRYLRSDGTICHAILSAVLLRHAEGTPDRFVSVMQDITSQAQAGEALRESEARLRGVFEQAHVGIAEVDAAGRLIAANPRMCEMTGYTLGELLDESWMSITHPDDVAANAILFKQALAGSIDRYSMEKRYIRKDGSVLWAQLGATAIRDPSGGVTRFISVVSDVTERRSLEHQLQHSQRMESLGRLAGGIAHDFNNLLTVITGSASLLTKQLDGADPRHTLADQVVRASVSASGLTRQLLAFARRQTTTPAMLDVRQLIEGGLPLARRLLRDDIELRPEFGPCSLPILADASQWEQILLNIVVNAQDAMPTGGVLTISTAKKKLELEDRDLARGSYAVISFTDTGHGIDESALPHIFEPFYTTKPEGTGTGLGLATVYGIVKQGGGMIRAGNVGSREPKGARFTVYWPLHVAASDAVSEVKSPPLRPATRTDAATLLVVEDQTDVRRFIVEGLRQNGFRVVEAANGSAALELAGRSPTPIELLLTDSVMPGMSGSDLCGIFRDRWPGTARLMMSGYPSRAPAAMGEDADAAPLLYKPFTLDELLAAISAVLPTREPAASFGAD